MPGVGRMETAIAIWRRLRLVLTAAFVAVSLAACQSALYSNLSEPEANEMLAVLMANGVSASKAAAKEGFTLSVAERDMLRAIALLKDAGYPRSSRDSIGRVFQKSGIMSSPFEERVRYIYALGEDVAQTLSYIDGVVTARVHIVLPDAPQLGRPIKPSSASVFIRHRPGVDLDFFVPQIRRLVSSAIEGLEYQAVTVVLTEAQPTRSANPTTTIGTVEVLPGLSVRETDVGRFWQVAGLAGLVLAVLLATSIAAIVIALRGRSAPKSRETAPVPLVEPS